jgi:hypothetical protein
MRLDLLWMLAGSGAAASVAALVFRRGIGSSAENAGARRVMVSLIILIGSFAFISIFAGRAQSISYFRFSLFFLPLTALFGAVGWALLTAELQEEAIAAPLQRGSGETGWRAKLTTMPPAGLLRCVVPASLLVLVPLTWKDFSHHFGHFGEVTGHAVRFASGRYSLAEAYANQDGGLAHGGINPGALAAWRHVPPGARIWSTNVDSYCMAPDCRIESIASFKLPYRVMEVLRGSPAQARQILKHEGLNYFLFAKTSAILDLLPYSQLFDPANIATNLAVRWTDGNTYLLTWKDAADTIPVGADFLEAYARRVQESKYDPWFRFSKFVPALEQALTSLRAQSHLGAVP